MADSSVHSPTSSSSVCWFDVGVVLRGESCVVGVMHVVVNGDSFVVKQPLSPSDTGME